MDKNSALYDFTQNLQGSVFRAAYQFFLGNMSEEEKAARPQPPALLQIKGGYAESPAWMLVQALEFAPEPLSVERFRRRAVYSAPKLTLALLEMLASEKYFDRKGEDYYLTNTGHELTARIKNNRIEPFVGFEPIPLADIQRLADYFKQVITASLTTEHTWCVEYSRRRAPDTSAPALAHIIQYGSDFNALRDDAHMAAYGTYDVQGHVWEAFSYVCADNAQNAADLYDKLAYRGFYTEDWQAALDELSERDWLSDDAGNYQATDAGKAALADVEAQTDDLFFAAWDALNAEEFADCVGLMQQLIEAVS